jgi:hypothetical protein
MLSKFARALEIVFLILLTILVLDYAFAIILVFGVPEPDTMVPEIDVREALRRLGVLKNFLIDVLLIIGIILLPIIDMKNSPLKVLKFLKRP